MTVNKKQPKTKTLVLIGTEDAEARSLVREMAGNSHDSDKLLAILNRHRELLGVRAGYVTAMALLFLTEGLFEGVVKAVDIFDPSLRSTLQANATEVEFQSLTEQL